MPSFELRIILPAEYTMSHIAACSSDDDDNDNRTPQ